MTLVIAFLLGMYLFDSDFWKVAVLVLVVAFALEQYVTYQFKAGKDTNEQILAKLNTLQAKMYDYVDRDLKIKRIVPSPSQQKRLYDSVKLTAMHLDSNLIGYLERISVMYDYNPEQYYKLVHGTDTILGMRRDIELYYTANANYPYNTADMLKRALEIKSNCVNNVHNFIYTVPKQADMYQYHSDIVQEYNELITVTINKIYTYSAEYTRINGIDATTKFTDYNPKYSVPLPHDESRNNNYLYNSKN